MIMFKEATQFSLNPVQMKIIESFAAVSSKEELDELTKVLRNFYANRLEKELEKSWNDGSFDQKKLESLKKEHLRSKHNI